MFDKTPVILTDFNLNGWLWPTLALFSTIHSITTLSIFSLRTDCNINLGRQLKLADIYIIFDLKSFTEKPALIKMVPQTRVRPENDASHIILKFYLKSLGLKRRLTVINSILHVLKCLALTRITTTTSVKSDSEWSLNPYFVWAARNLVNILQNISVFLAIPVNAMWRF